jgi:hypothetical protein
MRANLYILCQLFLVALSLSVGCKDGLRNELKALSLVETCKTLTIDMAMDDVVKKMGEPIKRYEKKDVRGRDAIVLVYPYPKLASEPIRCFFDRKTGKLIDAHCGEGYRLSK